MTLIISFWYRRVTVGVRICGQQECNRTAVCQTTAWLWTQQKELLFTLYGWLFFYDSKLNTRLFKLKYDNRYTRKRKSCFLFLGWLGLMQYQNWHDLSPPGKHRSEREHRAMRQCVIRCTIVAGLIITRIFDIQFHSSGSVSNSKSDQILCSNLFFVDNYARMEWFGRRIVW